MIHDLYNYYDHDYTLKIVGQKNAQLLTNTE